MRSTDLSHASNTCFSVWIVTVAHVDRVTQTHRVLNMVCDRRPTVQLQLFPISENILKN
jgi:hypothetical protein